MCRIHPLSLVNGHSRLGSHCFVPPSLALTTPTAVLSGGHSPTLLCPRRLPPSKPLIGWSERVLYASQRQCSGDHCRCAELSAFAATSATMSNRYSPPPSTTFKYHDPRDRVSLSDSKPLLSESPSASPTSSPTLRPAGTLTSSSVSGGRAVYFSLNGPPSSSSSSQPWWIRIVVPLLFSFALITFACLAYVARQGTTGGGGFSVGWRGEPYGARAVTPYSRLFRAQDQASARCPASSDSSAISAHPASSPYRSSPLLKPLPEHRALLPSVCGNWILPYQQLHASMSSLAFFTSHFQQHQSFPVPQLLVFYIDTRSTTGGISDRWPILSTAFLIALLTDRAIYFEWPGHEAAYSHRNLPHMHNTTWRTVYGRWRWYEERVDMFKALQANGTAVQQWPEPPSTIGETAVLDEAAHLLHGKTHDVALLFEGDAKAYIVTELANVDALRALYPATRPVVYIQAAYGGKGLTHYLYENNNIRPALEELGLRRELAHGCAMNLLLGLNEEVERIFEPLAWPLVDPQTLTVGIQIRMGDVSMIGQDGMNEKQKADVAWMSDDGALLRHGGMFMRCAQQLADMHRTSPSQPVVYFIVSDNVHLKSLLAADYNDTLVIPTTATFVVGHTDTGDRSIYSDKSKLQPDAANRYLQVAAGEQWLLGWTDYMVIDQAGGGFGRSAALRSLRVGRAWDGKKSGRQRCDGDTGFLTTKDWVSLGHKY